MDIEFKKELSEVNHPEHYNKNKFECIDVMEDVFGVEATKTFCILNAFKYIYRHENKGNPRKDVEKANWYLEKYIELEDKSKIKEDSLETWEI